MKTKLLTICLLLSTLLSGCMTAEMMYQVTTPYYGRHVDELVKVTGLPSEERVVIGKRILTWYVSNKGVIPITLPTTSTATVYGYGGITNVTITSSETTYHSFDYNCQLDVEVTEDYFVTGIRWDGNVGGCRIFYGRLKQGSVVTDSPLEDLVDDL